MALALFSPGHARLCLPEGGAGAPPDGKEIAMTKQTKAPTAPARVRVHTFNADLTRDELHAALDAVEDVFAAAGEYAQLNLRAARVGGQTVITATSRGVHGGDAAMTRRKVSGDTASDAQGYDWQIVKGAEVTARRNDRNAAILSEALARLPLLEAWLAGGKSGKRPCAKLTGKHYAVAVTANHKAAERILKVVEALA